MKKRRFLWIRVILGIVVVTLTINLVYGYANKEQIIQAAFTSVFSDNYQISSYSYLGGNFRAVLTYENEIAFDNIAVLVSHEDASFRPYEVSPNEAHLYHIKQIQGEHIIASLGFVAFNPPYNVCGVLFKLEGKTILYLARPFTNMPGKDKG